MAFFQRAEIILKGGGGGGFLNSSKKNGPEANFDNSRIYSVSEISDSLKSAMLIYNTRARRLVFIRMYF